MGLEEWWRGFRDSGERHRVITGMEVRVREHTLTPLTTCCNVPTHQMLLNLDQNQGLQALWTL